MAIGNEKKRIPFEEIIGQSICGADFCRQLLKNTTGRANGKENAIKKEAGSQKWPASSENNRKF